MEIPRLGVKSELQLLAYTAATAMPDPSSIFGLNHISRQCWILNPLNKARDRTRTLVLNPLNHNKNSFFWGGAALLWHMEVPQAKDQIRAAAMAIPDP